MTAEYVTADTLLLADAYARALRYADAAIFIAIFAIGSLQHESSHAQMPPATPPASLFFISLLLPLLLRQRYQLLMLRMRRATVSHATAGAFSRLALNEEEIDIDISQPPYYAIFTPTAFA